ncbi:MAG: phytanoyl-CoA dioxygenase family protein [Alphaproteobacteria bacterium]|nr:phytanoyl-CoA dioxygenase family protein [Alphaproteobacteria bacterium]
MLHGEPLRPITDDEVAAYERDGAVLLRGLFDLEWIELLREAVEADKKTPGRMVRHNTPPGGSGEFFVDFQLWQRWEGAKRFALEGPGGAIAARMMGAKSVNYYHDHLLVKEPGTQERTPWHHDQPYYPVEGWMVGSIWLPLDPVPEEICVDFIPGSHKWNRWFAPQFFKSGNPELQVQDPRFESIPDFEAQRGQYELLSWQLEPGDCIFFHGLVVHGASGNPSPQGRRRAYATRWLGEDARYAARAGQISPPLEGHGLQPGDAMDCEMFPRVWPRA